MLAGVNILIPILALLAAGGADAGPGYIVTIDGFAFRGWDAQCSRLRETYPACSAYRRFGNRCLSMHFSGTEARVGYAEQCGDVDEAARTSIALPLRFRDRPVSAAIAALVAAHGSRSARRRLNDRFLEDAETLAAILFRVTNEPD